MDDLSKMPLSQEERTQPEEATKPPADQSIDFMDPFESLKEFHKAFNHHIGEEPALVDSVEQDLRLQLMSEEMRELFRAIMDNDLVEIADALADVLYVVYGTAVSYGIDIRPIFNEVHRTNMAKRGGGKNAWGKSLKPMAWKAPRIRLMLAAQMKLREDLVEGGLVNTDGPETDNQSHKDVTNHSRQADE